MELSIKGDAKEIAALVLALQEQQDLVFNEASLAEATKRSSVIKIQ